MKIILPDPHQPVEYVDSDPRAPAVAQVIGNHIRQHLTQSFVLFISPGNGRDLRPASLTQSSIRQLKAMSSHMNPPDQIIGDQYGRFTAITT